MEKSINRTLNFFKGLACMCIVLLHVQFPNDTVYGITQAIARFGIPIFFMISGYFSYRTDLSELNKIMPKKIKHILKLCIIATLYWFVFQVVACIFGADGRDLSELFFEKWFTLKFIFNWIIFNVDPFINILWFLFALLYCYLIFWGVSNLKIGKAAYFIFIPLFFVLYGIECSSLFVVSIPTIYYRNCWLFGLPLFYLGNFINYYLHEKTVNIKNSYLIISIIGGELLAIVEWLFLDNQEVYIGSLIAAIAIMLFSIKNPILKMHKIGKAIEFIGDKLGFTIYIIHISVMVLFDKVLKIVGIYENTPLFLMCLKPFIVIILSCIAAYVLYLILNKLRKKKS